MGKIDINIARGKNLNSINVDYNKLILLMRPISTCTYIVSHIRTRIYTYADTYTHIQILHVHVYIDVSNFRKYSNARLECFQKCMACVCCVCMACVCTWIVYAWFVCACIVCVCMHSLCVCMVCVCVHGFCLCVCMRAWFVCP